MPSSKPDSTTSNQQEMDTVIIEDNPFLTAGFTQVPNAILRHPSLSDGAKLVYSMLLSYAWSDNSSFPGQERLGADLNKDRRTIIRLINELKEKKLVRVERRGLGRTNIYYLRTKFEADVTKMSHQEVTKMSDPDGTKMSHKEYEGSKDTQNKNTQTSRKGNALNSQKGREASSKKTYSHIAQGTIGNETKTTRTSNGSNGRRGSTAGLEHISTSLQHLEIGRQPGSTGSPQPAGERKQGNWKKAPLFIQGTIGDWFSLEMHDQAINSTITRVHRIYQAWKELHPDLDGEALQDTFYSLMQEARTKSKHANITTTTPSGHPNRTPFFLACLEDLAGVREQPIESKTTRNSRQPTRAD